MPSGSRAIHSFPDRWQSLLDGKAYPDAPPDVSLIETHISWVLLAGDFAYKIKRPVQLPFVDQRSVKQRHFLCDEELRLNRRFAPDLYLNVVPITVRGKQVQMGGQGTVEDYAVRMRRFDRDQELDHLLQTRRIDAAELADFGQRLACLHRSLPMVEPQESWGRAAVVRMLLLRNLDETATVAQEARWPLDAQALRAALGARLDACAQPIEARRQRGCVRECHGDLHTRNIVRVGSALIAFDCVEFNPAFRWIDIADEVAFLTVDLEAGGHNAHAQAFLSGYLDEGGDFDSCRVLDLYKAHRALVRAKVDAISARGQSEAAGSALRHEFDAYMERARRCLASRRGNLLITAGLSGSGKTWLGRRIAAALGLTHIRSDVERKRMAGLKAGARTFSAPGAGLYAQAHTDAVYEWLAACAEPVLAAGWDALVDATFLRREQRDRFVKLARRFGVRLVMLHCHADPAVLRQRLQARQRATSDPSEADERVLEWQLAGFEPVAAEEDIDLIDIDTTGPTADERVLAALRERGWCAASSIYG